VLLGRYVCMTCRPERVHEMQGRPCQLRRLKSTDRRPRPSTQADQAADKFALGSPREAMESRLPPRRLVTRAPASRDQKLCSVTIRRRTLSPRRLDRLSTPALPPHI